MIKKLKKIEDPDKRIYDHFQDESIGKQAGSFPKLFLILPKQIKLVEKKYGVDALDGKNKKSISEISPDLMRIRSIV